MWELEYPLLFGLPGNKLESFHARTRCVCPFRSRKVAEVAPAFENRAWSSSVHTSCADRFLPGATAALNGTACVFRLPTGRGSAVRVATHHRAAAASDRRNGSAIPCTSPRSKGRKLL